MGATGWDYNVPYQPDMGRVLDDLQADVFARGAYQKPAPDLSVLDEAGFFEADEDARDELLAAYGLDALREPLRRVGVDGLRAWLEDLDAAPAVQTRDELAALQCLSWEGTGSILDIDRVRPEPAPGALFPLPPARARRLFGTEQPAREMIEADLPRVDRLRDEYERGQGVYVILYDGGRPASIYIEGASGD